MSGGDFGTYHTGFLIAFLNMRLDDLDEYHKKTSEYLYLRRITDLLLNSSDCPESCKEKLRINATKYLQPFKDATNNISTFMHEYIHYLQDITTMIGVTSLTLYSNLIQEVMHELGTNGDKIVELPFLSGHNEEIEQMIFLLKFYLCANEEKKFKKLHHFDKIESEKEILFKMLHDVNPDLFPSDLDNDFHDIKVYCNDCKEIYNFGASIICESMAYLFERIVFNIPERINEYPYNICQMIVNSYCPTIKENEPIILAICELSLMHSHSGEMFYKIITEIKNENLNFNSVKDFEKYFSYRTQHLYDAFEESIRTSNDAIDFLYPTKIEKTRKISLHLKEVFQAGLSMRKTGLFISRAAENRNSNGEINCWFENLGLPLLIDQTYNFFSKPDIDLTEMLCPKALESLFYEPEKKCFLYDICQQQTNFNPCFNETICSQRPWSQTESDLLCPLATYLHHYSIDTKHIKKK